ncbi:hypothetical protein DFH07DRAFT_936687 [Mycena maculata]|uniref:Uncharacterized protein n=1 Tax=Mycena maculata TaxID=230809 RepID=A0AAD7K875_9AGAR|nr:hypothetical protein DFH07DRAFT_936687 [Mycena maculata]
MVHCLNRMWDALAGHTLQWALINLSLFIFPALTGLLGLFFSLSWPDPYTPASYALGYAIAYFSICAGSALVLFAKNEENPEEDGWQPTPTATTAGSHNIYHGLDSLFRAHHLFRASHCYGWHYYTPHFQSTAVTLSCSNMYLTYEGRRVHNIDTMQSLGVRTLSHLHMRITVLGGSNFNAPESTKIFDAAADILQADVKAYRTFFNALGDPDNDPFFSVENAPNWITSHGYQLFLQSDESTVVSRNPEDASPRQLKAYQKFILSDEYITHPFFSLENTVTWINPVSFQTYMDLQYSSQQYLPVQHLELVHLRDPTPCASSWYSIAPLSRASSPVSFVSEIPSRPPSSMSMDGIILNDSDQEFPTHVSGPLPRTESVYTSLLEISQVQPPVNAVARVERSPSPTFSATSNVKPRKSIRRKGKGRAEADSSRIKITRQLYVNEIVDMAVQSTWTVPRVPTAYRVDISKFEAQLAICGGKDQESWWGSTGHTAGDVTAYGLTSDPNEGVLARRCQFYCNGVDTYEFIDPELFAGCERYKPDIEQMQELWNHELEANELEAASAPSIMSRFYSRIINSRCKIQCDGIPIMVPVSRVVILVSFLLPTEYKIIQGPSSHGKKFFIGCSRWSKDERFEHIYWPIAANINEDILRFVMDNNGRVPNAETTVNETCVLTVHPRVGLKNCPYSHIHHGQIKPAKIQNCPCLTQMLVFIPVDSTVVKTALVILLNPDNHPAHPQAKPSAEDRVKLGKAVQLAGLTGLTAHKLLNAPATSAVYSGRRVAESSPAYTSRRKMIWVDHPSRQWIMDRWILHLRTRFSLKIPQNICETSSIQHTMNQLNRATLDRLSKIQLSILSIQETFRSGH